MLIMCDGYDSEKVNLMYIEYILEKKLLKNY